MHTQGDGCVVGNGTGPGADDVVQLVAKCGLARSTEAFRLYQHLQQFLLLSRN